MKKFLQLFFVLGTIVMLGACEKEVESDAFKVALILPGKIDDVSWNQAMYEGMMLVKEEFGDLIEVSVSEEVYEVTDIEPALRDYAAEGFDLIFGHGFQFMEPILKVAEEYPDTYFALGSGYKTTTNSVVYDIHLAEGGYIMGVIAALATETNKLGIVGGAAVSEIFRGHEGFKFGALSVNPDVVFQENFTGDWRDTQGAKTAVEGMYDAGVDIVWHSGDGIGLGAVQGAKEKNKMVLGNVADQTDLAPKNVLSGVIYQWDAVIRDILNDALDGKIKEQTPGEKFYFLGSANEGIKYAEFRGDFVDLLTTEERTLIEQMWSDLKAGVMVLPEFDPNA